MDPIWTQLPNDLFVHVCKHLDSATRRDLGMKPRRLTELPRLDLHFHKGEGVFMRDMSIICTPDALIYERFRRVPFMNVGGIEIFKTEEISSVTWTRPIQT